MKKLSDYPEIASQWNYAKNGNLLPSDVSLNSKKKVWWKCSIVDDHEWEARPNDRAQGHNCPCCRGLKAVKSNCLATTQPELAKQWHPTKNGNLTPNDVVSLSNKRFWWKCPISNDHEWETSIAHRVAHARNCPCCCHQKTVKSNCLNTTHPELAKQWHSIKNGKLTPNDVVAGSKKKVWWKCIKGHEWIADCSHRSYNNGTGCPICKESKGEKKIAKILVQKSIQFKRQYRFKSCKLKAMLPFDFIVWHNKKVYAIEYQGRQHYEPSTFGSKKKDPKELLKIIQNRDAAKSEWAKENNIQLLIVPYWEKDIENMINKLLN